MEKIVYVPANYHQPRETELLKSARQLKNAATIIAIVSLAIVTYFWQTTRHTADEIFYVIIGVNALMIIYSLFEKWLSFGCFRSFVKVFAWTTFGVTALTGVALVYFLIVGAFSKPDQLLFLVWLIVVGKYPILFKYLLFH